MPLRIAFDPRWQEGGIGRFAREVIARLEKMDTDIRPIQIDCKLAAPLSPLYLSLALRKVQADVFWSPGFMPPLWFNIPSIVTVHDLIHRRHGGVLRRFYYDHCARPLIRSLNGVMTVSEHARLDIESWLGKEAPVRVVGNGVSRGFVAEGAALSLGKPYVLYCGNHRPHKNLPRMFEAFAKSALAKDMLLAVTGESSPALVELAARFNVTERMYCLGQMNEEQLACAYRGASLLLMVSLEEGFGLPVVEAMASGTPVVCSENTALEEVAAGAACCVDPLTVDSIATGIDRILSASMYRDQLIMAGKARAADFVWDEVAGRVYDVLREAAFKS